MHAASDAARDAANDGNDNQESDDRHDGDENCLVVIDPLSDFLERRTALALAAGAVAAGAAAGPVHEELVVRDALVGGEVRRRTGEHALRLGTSLGVVSARQAVGHVLALQVARSTLPRRAFEPIATRVAVILVLVDRAGGLVAGAGFQNVAFAGAGPADCAARCKLALIRAAIFVGGITDGAAGELARFGIAALVSIAACLAAAVAVLAGLHDAVPTLAANVHVGLDIFVVR